MKIDACLGIKVRYDGKARIISDSRGIWRWKEIVVGPDFLRFPPAEQQALLLHEVAHCKLRHLEKRLQKLWLLLWRPSRLFALCKEQEFEADRFVAAMGFGHTLAQAFGRIQSSGADPLHPTLQERIERLVL
jgi:Zn-dependent protease with chaperone function